jgi:amino acid transporter
VLGWAFDGVVPSWLGRVNERTSTPVNATIATWACAIVLLALYSFTTSFSVVTALLGFALTYFVTCLAAIVFPYRRRDLFEGSVGDTRFAGIPVLSIAGFFGAIGAAAMTVILLRDPSSGTQWEANRTQVLAIFGAVVVAAAIYGVAYVVGRRRGTDITDAYKELPPE